MRRALAGLLEADPAGAERRRALAVALAALAALPLAAHAAFSSLGFNPTDDGFVLAYSRRLLDGQVPHRDFISIRPVGSALLHAPWVLLGGAHTFWIARLAVWFELALVAWCWMRLGARLAGRPLHADQMLLGVGVGFVMTSFTFPVMPWHTIDALALASAGLVLAASDAMPRKVAGYALIGAAALCRQNFLPIAPLAALALGDRRSWQVGVAALAPLALYALTLLPLGALGPALAQIASQSGLQETGIRPYLGSPWSAAGLAAGVGCGLLGVAGPRGSGARAPFLGAVLSWASLFAAACTMTSLTGTYVHGASYALFAAALGITLVTAWRRGWRDPATRFGALALLVAWCASISIGLNTPALAAAPLVVALLLPAWDGAPASAAARGRAFRAAGALAQLAAFAAIWIAARSAVIYRDGPATELTRRLDGVLPGGAGLRTNPRTFAMLADLGRATTAARGRPCAVVADYAGWWVKAPERNPLSIDWPQSTELATPELQARAIADLEALRGRGRILVQKVYAGRIADRIDPLEDDSYYFVPRYVRSHFRRTGESRWFDVYE